MSKALYIAEKPSVAQEFAKALKINGQRRDGYLESQDSVVTWCVGHLVTMSYPEKYDIKYKRWSLDTLPFLPREFKYEVIPGVQKQFEIVKGLLNREDVDTIYVCTDSGREGEYIYRLVAQMAGVHGKKEKRVWIDSQTEEEIMRGIREAKDLSAYDNLSASAYLRAKEDYLMGINFSRVLTLRYGNSVSNYLNTKYQAISVGRVMTCVLGMVVRREREIRAFVKTPFYRVLSSIALEGENFEGEWRAVEGSRYFQTPYLYKENGFKEKAYAEKLIQELLVSQPLQCTVEKIERKKENRNPPLLFNLAELQNVCSKLFKISPDETLKIVQELYEKKLVTYPRTDSRFLTEDMAHSLTDLVKLAFHTFPVEDVDNIPVHAEQVVNNKKVTDHHAIIPTRELQKCNLSELPKGELAILQLISNRLCVAVGDPHRYAETVIELDCGGTVFSTKGKTVVQDGWKALVQKNDSTKSDENVQTLPSVSVGDEMTVSGTEIKEGKTSPPKHFTEDTLLSAMETAGADEMPDEVERKGLGTPATRAGIIEKLVRIGFLERKGDKKTKHLIPTHKGTALVTVMPEQIQSPSMTADWEEKLLLIEKGEYASEDFMDEIKDVIAGLIQNYEVIRDSEVMMSKEANSIGKCPLCGSAVEDKAKAFFCSNRACKFALWKNNRYFASIGKSMTSATAQKLLGSGKVKLKNCKSERTGNTFDATVFMEVSDDGKTKFSMEFENGGKRK